jgi:hypothetical protein
MRFKTTLEQSGKTATGFRVPADVVEALGKGKRPPVVVTINGYSYRNTVAVYGDTYMIGVAAEHRGPAGVKAGDEIEVDLELDTAPREVDVPEDLATALDAAPDAKRFFESLSYSNRRRLVLGIEDAKTAETRQRRVDKTVAQLAEGRA